MSWTFARRAGNPFVTHQPNFNAPILCSRRRIAVLQFAVSEWLNEPVNRQLLLGGHVIDNRFGSLFAEIAIGLGVTSRISITDDLGDPAFAILCAGPAGRFIDGRFSFACQR